MMIFEIFHGPDLNFSSLIFTNYLLHPQNLYAPLSTAQKVLFALFLKKTFSFTNKRTCLACGKNRNMNIQARADILIALKEKKEKDEARSLAHPEEN